MFHTPLMVASVYDYQLQPHLFPCDQVVDTLQLLCLPSLSPYICLGLSMWLVEWIVEWVWHLQGSSHVKLYHIDQPAAITSYTMSRMLHDSPPVPSVYDQPVVITSYRMSQLLYDSPPPPPSVCNHTSGIPPLVLLKHLHVGSRPFHQLLYLLLPILLLVLLLHAENHTSCVLPVRNNDSVNWYNL